MAQVTQEQYESMWNAYCERQTVQYVKEKCTVNRATAARAVKSGWPSRHWPALSVRHAEALAAAQAKQDAKTTESLATTKVKLSSGALRAAEKAIAALDQWVPSESTTLRELMSVINEASRLVCFLGGEEDSRPGGKALADAWAITVSDDELDSLDVAR